MPQAKRPAPTVIGNGAAISASEEQQQNIATGAEAQAPAQPNTWRDLFRVHPAADLLPLMSEAELLELAHDIKKNGLHEKIKVWWNVQTHEKCLVDGRNRAAALSLIGESLIDGYDDWNDEYIEEVRVGQWEWDHAVTRYIFSLNIARRHLTQEQRRDVIAKLLKANPDQSDRSVAKTIGTDHKTVGAVRTELQSGGEIPHVEKTVGADGKSYSKKARPEQPTETTATDNDIAKGVVTAESTDERDRLYGPLTGCEWIELGEQCRRLGRRQRRQKGRYHDEFLKLIEYHNVPILRWDEEERRQEEGDGGA